MLVAGEARFTLPKGVVLRTFILDHMIHHRAQLGVYLRHARRAGAAALRPDGGLPGHVAVRHHRHAGTTAGLATNSRHNMHTLDPDRFELLTFDCYGTLVDWEAGIVAAAQRVGAAHGASPTEAAILASFAAAEHIVQAERYRTYREVLALTLDRMGRELGFRPTPAECDAFAASVGDWPPFPDTVVALGRLAARYRLGIVSNVDDDLFAETRPGTSTPTSTGWSPPSRSAVTSPPPHTSRRWPCAQGFR